MTSGSRYIGKPLERFEDLRLLRGKGQFVDDLHAGDTLFLAICRSPVAHGLIQSIDTSAAKALPGVRLVLTAEDLSGSVPTIPMRMEPLSELLPFEQPVIAVKKVRYVGEPIAVVVADSPALAEDGVGLIGMDIESLPVFMGRQTPADTETLLFDNSQSNVALTVSGVRGDVDATFRNAPYVRRETFKVHRHTALPMETRGLFAEWNRKAKTLRISGLMKVPFAIRSLTARLLEMPEDRIEGVESDVGGGFGMRGEFYPEDFWVPYVAKQLQCSVKWIEDRREHLTAITHARESECELEIACTREGDILALRGVAWFDIGAYIRPNGMTAPRNLAQMIPGPYRIRHLRMDVHMLASNKTPSGSYRGPGRFEADFFRERLIDLAAEDLGIDRVEFRRRNLLTEADMPFHLGTVLPFNRDGGTTDTGDYRITLDRALKEIGWAEKQALQGRLIDGKYHGLGIGCYVEGGAQGPAENARLVLRSDGNVEVYVGSSGIGQGLETAFAQIAADSLGVNISRIAGVFHGSTGYVKLGYGTSGSRSTVMGGSALLDASENLKQAIRKRAAEQFGCEPDEVQITDEMRTVSAGDKFRTLAELVSEKLEAEGTFKNDKRTYSYGTHAAHVTVDPGTGNVEVLDYVSVEDVGRIINPGTLRGQTLGAIVQGLGATLLEHLVYDEDGQLLTGSLASYLVPAAGDFPSIRAVALEMYPSPVSPLGAKGAGEGGIIPVAGVIANAVASALSEMGVRTNELPLSPDRVWALINEPSGETSVTVRTIKRGNASFSFLDRGTGTPLVLLHGVGSAARSWKRQVDALSSRLRVIAWDAPGYGTSTALAPAEPSAQDYAASLQDFLAALGLDRFHLVGHSLGCIMAARYARLHPERILSLTLASVATGHAQLPASERERLRAGRLDDLAALGPRGMAEKRGPRLLGPHATPEDVRAVVETMAMIRPDGYTQAVRMLSNADTRADVRVLAPDLRVQFIYGDADVITTPQQNESVHAERPGAPVHVLTGAGHALYIEQPEAFNRLVLQWVTS